MLSKKSKAAAPATAPKNTQQHESYRNSVSASRAKLQIGEILLALKAPLSPEQRRKHWQRFEAKLRQYLDLKFTEVTR